MLAGKILKNSILLFLLALLFPFITTAKSGFLNGTVTDSLNHPVYGATVGVVGKAIGVTTNDNGKYRLEIPAGKTWKVVFYFTGLGSDTVSVKLSDNEERIINCSLKGKVYQMKDVTIEEKSLRNSNVQSINPKSIGKIGRAHV